MLKSRANELTEYEQGEILEYKQVHFWVRGGGIGSVVPARRLSPLVLCDQRAVCQGNTSKKIRANTRAPNNHGFDDERGDYKLVMRDHLACVVCGRRASRVRCLTPQCMSPYVCAAGIVTRC